MKSKPAWIAAGLYGLAVSLMTGLSLYGVFVKHQALGGVPVILITMPWSLLAFFAIHSNNPVITTMILVGGALINAGIIYALVNMLTAQDPPTVPTGEPIPSPSRDKRFFAISLAPFLGPILASLAGWLIKDPSTLGAMGGILSLTTLARWIVIFSGIYLIVERRSRHQPAGWVIAGTLINLLTPLFYIVFLLIKRS